MATALLVAEQVLVPRMLMGLKIALERRFLVGRAYALYLGYLLKFAS